MEKPMRRLGLHRGLELRLDALADRIEALRQATANAKGAEKFEDLGELGELKQRYEILTDRLHALNEEGPGFRQSVKAELEAMADDLSGIVEDFIMRLDAKYLGARTVLPTRKW